MVGHRHEDHILGAPGRHVAGDAVGLAAGIRAVRRAAEPLPFAAAGPGLVTALARRPVVRGAFFGCNPTVRIVTAQTAQTPLAFTPAAALHQPVGVMVDLEALVTAAIGLLGVDRQDVVGQRLARPKRVVGAREPPHSGKRHRRLQVALEADAVAPAGRQPAGVDDRRGQGPALVGGGGTEQRDASVLGPGSVAPLAAGALGQVGGEPLRCPGQVGARRHFGVAVMAEHAFAPHSPGDALVVGAVVARGHSPGSALAVPRDGQLVELAGLGLEKVGARGVPRAQDPIHPALEQVRDLAVLVLAVASEEQAVVLPAHLVMTPGRRVEKGRTVEPLDHLGGARAIKRSRHPDLAVAVGDVPMADRASAVRDIAGRRAGGHPQTERRERVLGRRIFAGHPGYGQEREQGECAEELPHGRGRVVSDPRDPIPRSPEASGRRARRAPKRGPRRLGRVSVSVSSNPLGRKRKGARSGKGFASSVAHPRNGRESSPDPTNRRRD